MTLVLSKCRDLENLAGGPMQNIFRLFAIVLLYVVSALAARHTEMRRIGSSGQATQKIHTDRVLVELTSPVHRRDFRGISQGRGRFKDVLEVAVEPPFTPEGFIARFREEDSRTGQRRVKRAELSPVVTLRGVPNDRFWRNQWYFGADQGFPVPSIGFYNDPGLDLSHGLVYVADTGCPANHEDLDPETIVDRQKFVSDSYPGDLRDRNGHGTAVIGIMAAKTNNGVGIASMTPDVKVGCVQALDEFGEGDLLGLINMLDYVSSLQIQRKLVDPLAWLLLNLSLGGYGYSELLEEAKDRCAAAGVLIVAAAGNNGFNLSRDVYDWFCSKSSPHIVVVGATDLNDQPANFGGGYATNYGPTVDVFAPGVGIASLGLNNTYVTERGTSFATPLVTSTVALMLAKHQAATPKAIKQRLSNGDPFKGRQVGVNFSCCGGEFVCLEWLWWLV
jgi:subtilisin family serine protease